MATQWISSNGGSFVYRQLLPVRQEWLDDLPGASYLATVESVSLQGSGITDISELKSLSRPKYLDLSNNRIHDISSLRGLNHPVTLSLDSNPVSDLSPLRHHECPKCFRPVRKIAARKYDFLSQGSNRREGSGK